MDGLRAPALALILLATSCRPVETPACGPASLYAAARRLDLSVSMEQVSREVERVNPSRQVSFADLAIAAHRLGLSTTGYRTSLEDLRAKKAVAVLELDYGHLVTLVCFEGDHPLIVDARFPGDVQSKVWSRARLEGCWTGAALVIVRT